jgi:hypothetical protein
MCNSCNGDTVRKHCTMLSNLREYRSRHRTPDGAADALDMLLMCLDRTALPQQTLAELCNPFSPDNNPAYRTCAYGSAAGAP